MRFLIVEDLRPTSEMIKGMIKDHIQEENITEQAFNYVDAKSMILENHYDILFLDITLPRGNTFELLQDLPPEKKNKSEIIFLTGHDTKDYFLNAIKHSASGYVLKPIDIDEFKAAINKSLDNLNKASESKDLLESTKPKAANIPISLSRGAVSIMSAEEISHLVGEGSVTKVHLIEGEPLTSVKNLGHYKDSLVGNYGFLVASKSTLVNPEFIESYKHSLLEITLKNGYKMSCSRRGGRNLKEWLNSMS